VGKWRRFIKPADKEGFQQLLDCQVPEKKRVGIIFLIEEVFSNLLVVVRRS